jgi:hypothetical protein
MGTWLTVIIGVVQLVLGAMGVYVSLRPPRKEHHWYWIAAFIIVGLLGVGLTGWLAKAGDEAQIAANTEVHEAEVAATNANTAATNANTAATSAATAALAAENETKQARAEAREATTTTQKLINKKSTETRSTILQWRSDTETAVGKILRPERTLGDKRAALIQELQKAAPNKVAITPARGNQDCLDFANEIESAFKEAGWDVVGTEKMAFITKDAVGLGIVVKGTTDKELRPDQIAVARAFYSIGMQLIGDPSETGDKGPVELYIGLP